MNRIISHNSTRALKAPRLAVCFAAALAALAALAAIALNAASVEGSQQGRGFAEARATVHPGADGEQWQFVQRLRPTFQARLSDRSTLVAVVEAGLSQGRDLSDELRRTIEESEIAPLIDESGCVWSDRGHSRLRVRDAGDYLEVDRLYLDLYQGRFDLRIGRQSIYWGSAQFFNPTDPFPEVLISEPWRPRRGVNALRATVPFGLMNDVVTVAAIDDGLHHPSLASRLRLNTGGVDIAMSGAWRGDTDATQVGLDLRGTTGVGWWIEAALFPGSGAYAEAAIGIDYSFPVLERLVAFAQYYRNGAGAADPDHYHRRLAPAGAPLPRCEQAPAGLFGDGQGEPDPFERFALGRDYVLLGVRSDITPDFSANAFMLQNMNDGTALCVPTLSYLVSDHLDLSLSARIPFRSWGDGGEFQPRSRDLCLELDAAPGDPLVLDLSALVPDAIVTMWIRLSF